MDGEFIEIPDTHGESYEPTETEMVDYLQWLGGKMPEDRDLLWIGRDALKAPIPAGWKLYQRKDGSGDPFYFNRKTGESLWDHPLDQHFKALFASEKRKKIEGGSPARPPRVDDDLRVLRERGDSAKAELQQRQEAELQELEAAHRRKVDALRAAHAAEQAEQERLKAELAVLRAGIDKAPSAALGEFHLRFPQVSAAVLPTTDSDDCRFLSVRLGLDGRAALSSEIGLNGRDVLRTRSSCSLSFDRTQPDITVGLILLEESSAEPRTELARVDLPLDWFPPNSVVRESFRMRPLVDGLAAPVLFLEAHRIEDGARPWSGPFAQIVPRALALEEFAGGFRSIAAAAPLLVIESQRPFTVDSSPPLARGEEEKAEAPPPEAAPVSPPVVVEPVPYRSIDIRRVTFLRGVSFFPAASDAGQCYTAPPPLPIIIEPIESGT
jgi:hypothetical protein